MSDKTISDLREHLFATIEALRDKENPMDVARAKAISEVARQVIDSAKVEVEHMKVSGDLEGTRFIPSNRALPAGQPAEPGNGIAGVTRHLIQG